MLALQINKWLKENGKAGFSCRAGYLPSLKLTANTPENQWLEDEFPFEALPIFRCELLISIELVTSIQSSDAPKHKLKLDLGNVMLVSGKVDVHDFHRCNLYPPTKKHQKAPSAQSKPHRNFGNDPSLSQTNLLVSGRVLSGIYLGTKSNDTRGALVFRVCFSREFVTIFIIPIGSMYGIFTAKTRVSPTQGLGFRVYGFRV